MVLLFVDVSVLPAHGARQADDRSGPEGRQHEAATGHPEVSLDFKKPD
jgi:hypothetical protein